MQKEHMAICESTSSNRLAAGSRGTTTTTKVISKSGYKRAVKILSVEEAFDTIIVGNLWWRCQGEYH
jgi:hypothetical protein